MTSAPSPWSRPALTALWLLLVPLAFVALAATSVGHLLDRQARVERDARDAARGALRWNFAIGGGVVAHTSHGLADAHADRDGLHIARGDSSVDLQLALGLRPLALAQARSAMLVISGEGPAFLRLVAFDRDGRAEVGEHAVWAGGAEHIALPLPRLDPAEPASALRLRVDRPRPTSVVLHHLDLTRTASDSAVCAASRDSEETLARCGAAATTIELPPSAWPEAQLALYDRLRAGSLAVVTPSPQLITLRPLFDIGANAAFALVLGGLAAAATVRVALQQRAPPETEGMSAQVAILALLPPLTMLFLGSLAEGRPAAEWGFGACVLLLLTISWRLRRWTWIGTRQAWKDAGWLTLAGAVLLFGVACLPLPEATPLAWRWPDASKLVIYPLWATLQQVILVGLLTPVAFRLARQHSVRGAVLAGAGFGLLHLPNLTLMLATFVAATAWSLHAQRHRAVLPVVASHTLLGLALVTVAPPWLLRSAEIGARFLLPASP